MMKTIYDEYCIVLSGQNIVGGGASSMNKFMGYKYLVLKKRGILSQRFHSLEMDCPQIICVEGTL